MCIHQLQSLPTDETMDVQVWVVGFRWLVGWRILPWGTGFANKKSKAHGFSLGREGEVRSGG